MRPVALVTVSYAGCRAKIHALCEQIFGPNSVDVYRRSDVMSDMDIVGTSGDHTYDRGRIGDIAEEVAKHEYVHVFCDRCSDIWPIIKTGRPLILHRHDTLVMRGFEDPAQREIYKRDNLIHVFVSPAHRDYICGTNSVPVGSTHVIYNWPLRAQIEKCVAPQVPIRNSIVYFGGNSCKPSHAFGYRFYVLQWQKLAEAGIDVHAYIARDIVPEWYSLYRSVGHENIYPHARIPHGDLYSELARYDVGFLGYNDLGEPGPSKRFIDYAHSSWPNKAFDYMAAGIPTLGYSVGDSEEVVQQWGVCINDLEGLVDAYHKARDMQIDFKKYQSEYCMENQAPLLKQLYEITRVKQ